MVGIHYLKGPVFRLPGRAWKIHAVCMVSSNFHENRGLPSLLTDYVVQLY